MSIKLQSLQTSPRPCSVFSLGCRECSPTACARLDQGHVGHIVIINGAQKVALEGMEGMSVENALKSSRCCVHEYVFALTFQSLSSFFP